MLLNLRSSEKPPRPSCLLHTTIIAYLTQHEKSTSKLQSNSKAPEPRKLQFFALALSVAPSLRSSGGTGGLPMTAPFFFFLRFTTRFAGASPGGSLLS